MALTKDFGTFFMSILGFTGDVAADRTDDAAVDVEAVGGTTDGLEDMDGFPLTWPVGAATDWSKSFHASPLSLYCLYIGRENEKKKQVKKDEGD
jgi:hypothetical protein